MKEALHNFFTDLHQSCLEMLWFPISMEIHIVDMRANINIG